MKDFFKVKIQRLCELVVNQQITKLHLKSVSYHCHVQPHLFSQINQFSTISVTHQNKNMVQPLGSPYHHYTNVTINKNDIVNWNHSSWKSGPLNSSKLHPTTIHIKHGTMPQTPHSPSHFLINTLQLRHTSQLPNNLSRPCPFKNPIVHHHQKLVLQHFIN